MAVQYTHRRFVLPALAPLVYNLGIIVGGLIGAIAGDPSPESFLWGAVVGSAVGNFGLQWYGARRTNTWLIKPGKKASSVGEYLLLALPLMIGQSVAVLDEQFVRFFGQVEAGATSALSFARQLNMVPVGVIAQAAGVAAYPFLARLAARGDDDALVDTTGRAARRTMFIATGATAALIVLAKPMVRLLYQYGEFSSANVDLVARLLTIYALSIPAWGLHQILARHFYAKRKMWTPVLIGTLFTVIAIPTWQGLYTAMGVEGFALASTLVISGYALGLLTAWGFDSGWHAVRDLTPTFLRGLLAAGAAVAVALPLVTVLVGDGDLPVWRGLGSAILGGLTVLGVFVGVSVLLRILDMRDLIKRR